MPARPHPWPHVRPAPDTALRFDSLGRREAFPTEAALEERFARLFEQTRGRVFVTWSAQNVDRTVTLYRACRRLALDVYSLDVLERIARPSLPRLGWSALQPVITRGLAGDAAEPGRSGAAHPGVVSRRQM